MQLDEKDCQDLDKIIAFLIEDGSFNDAEKFKEKLFPESDISYSEGLVDRLLEYGRNIVFKATNSGEMKLIRADTSAKSFLQKGGFTGEYKRLAEQQAHKNEVTKLEFEALKLSGENLRNKYFDYDKTKSRVKRNEIILWLGIALSVITIIIECSKHSVG